MSETLRSLTTDIATTHVSTNHASTGELPGLIRSVHQTLARLGTPTAELELKQEPAVSIRSSVKPDFLVCLENRKKPKMLKRHVVTYYQMTPADYRAKWKLPADYPMVAPNYAAQRKELR